MKSFYKALKNVNLGYENRNGELLSFFNYDSASGAGYFGIDSKFKIILSLDLYSDTGSNSVKTGNMVLKYVLNGTNSHLGRMDRVLAVSSAPITHDEMLPEVHYLKNGIYIYPGPLQTYLKNREDSSISSTIFFTSDSVKIDTNKITKFYPPTTNIAYMDISNFQDLSNSGKTTFMYEGFEKHLSFDKMIEGINSLRLTSTSTLKADTIKIDSTEHTYTLSPEGKTYLEGTNSGSYEPVPASEYNLPVSFAGVDFDSNESYFYIERYTSPTYGESYDIYVKETRNAPLQGKVYYEGSKITLNGFSKTEKYFYLDGPFYAPYNIDEHGPLVTTYGGNDPYYYRYSQLDGYIPYTDPVDAVQEYRTYPNNPNVYVKTDGVYRRESRISPLKGRLYYVNTKSENTIKVENENIIFKQRLEFLNSLNKVGIKFPFNTYNNIKLSTDITDPVAESLEDISVNNPYNIYPTNMRIIKSGINVTTRNEPGLNIEGYMKIPLDITINEIRDLYGRGKYITKYDRYVLVDDINSTPRTDIKYYTKDPQTGRFTEEPIVDNRFNPGIIYYTKEDDGFGPLEFKQDDVYSDSYNNYSPTFGGGFSYNSTELYTHYNKISDIISADSNYGETYLTYRDFAYNHTLKRGLNITTNLLEFKGTGRPNPYTGTAHGPSNYRAYGYELVGGNEELRYVFEKGIGDPSNNVNICYIPTGNHDIVNRCSDALSHVVFKGVNIGSTTERYNEMKEINGHCLGFVPYGSLINFKECDCCYAERNLSTFDPTIKYYIAVSDNEGTHYERATTNKYRLLNVKLNSGDHISISINGTTIGDLIDIDITDTYDIYVTKGTNEISVTKHIEDVNDFNQYTPPISKGINLVNIYRDGNIIMTADLHDEYIHHFEDNVDYYIKDGDTFKQVYKLNNVCNYNEKEDTTPGTQKFEKFYKRTMLQPAAVLDHDGNIRTDSFGNTIYEYSPFHRYFELDDSGEYKELFINNIKELTMIRKTKEVYYPQFTLCTIDNTGNTPELNLTDTFYTKAAVIMAYKGYNASAKKDEYTVYMSEISNIEDSDIASAEDQYDLSNLTTGAV